MKVYLLIIIMFITGPVSSYEQLINTFPEDEYNGNDSYLIRSLVGMIDLDLEDEYPLVAEPLSLKYLCNNDSSECFYEYDLYHMELGHLIEHVKDNYDHYAIASFRRGDYDLIVYSKHNHYSEERHYYLRSLDKKGKKVDEIEVGNLVPEGNYISYSYRFGIVQHQTVKTFSYRDSVSFADERKTKVPSTKVLINTYKIDSLGSFDLVSNDSVFLKNNVIHYDNFDTQPNANDPIAEYWTQ